jgi:hypothetical protein
LFKTESQQVAGRSGKAMIQKKCQGAPKDGKKRGFAISGRAGFAIVHKRTSLCACDSTIRR